MYLEMWIGLDYGIGVYNVLTSPLKPIYRALFIAHQSVQT